MNLFRKPAHKPRPAHAVFHAYCWRDSSGGISIEPHSPDGSSIGSMRPGAWAFYGPVDFGDGEWDLLMAFVSSPKGDARIVARINSPEGREIASLAVEATEAADLFREQYAPLKPVRGVHDLYVTFPDGPLGLDWFIFSKDPDRETPEQHARRMRWWREARFGQFVHWGPYSVLGRGEWVMYQENWPREDYELQAAARFFPDAFRPGEWIRGLAGAGQKYLVFTAKHHDGFCMSRTRIRGFGPVGESRRTGRYNITDFSRGNRDPVWELARECRKRKIRFGLYYSILDWHHRTQLPVADGSGLTDMLPGMKPHYLAEMKDQLRELVERVDPDLLWFDGDWGGAAWWWTAADGKALYRYLRTLKPSLIVNERVKRDQGLGDFRTPEQIIPESALEGDWESCLTMNDHWGYHAEDDHWKPARELIRSLVDIASKGGNLLLNVGPKPNGSLPWETRAGLKAMGRWMRVYGESIYGSSASPFSLAPAWGRCTAKSGLLYAHAFDWPADRILRLPALRNMIGAVYPMARPGTPLSFRRAGEGIEIDLPARAPDPWDSVIVLEVDGMPEAVPES